MLRSILIGAALAVSLASSALAEAPRTYKIGSIVIEAPWARATPAGAKVAGGYLKITNTGQQADRLTGGSLPIASDVEVHEMSMANGVARMRRLQQGLEIKPGQTVELKPGGYHLMFMGLHGALKDKDTIKGTLVFEKAGSVEVEYKVAPIGAQSGGKMHMH
jgi:copper(I)-binding protein